MALYVTSDVGEGVGVRGDVFQCQLYFSTSRRGIVEFFGCLIFQTRQILFLYNCLPAT